MSMQSIDPLHKPASNRMPQVIAAACVTVILAGLLAVRLFANNPATLTPPPATVPAPKAIDLAKLELPDWYHRDAKTWAIEFKTDLDLLAPLGTGSENAGVWFKDFTKPNGARYDEAKAAMDARIEHPRFKQVLPSDYPLLAEAEPWCDQATMHFYPDFYPIEGWKTQIPNLLVPLMFAKTWVARALAGDDPQAAMEDCRRAIRLGRLLRQEDAIVIGDLIGLACIRLGAEGIYQLAIKQGDTELALVAAIVQGEVAPQRLLTAERVNRVDMSRYLHRSPEGKIVLDMPDEWLDTLVDMAYNEPSKRFKGEAFVDLWVVRHEGTPAQQQRVKKLFEELSTQADPINAALAHWNNSNPPDQQLLEEIMKEW